MVSWKGAQRIGGGWVTYRNRKLLDIAHEMPCLAKFPHDCTEHLGCVPAHSDMQIFGRGIGHKTPDWAFAAMCHNAHREVDPKLAPQFDREQRQIEWMLAYVATTNWLFENGKLKVA
jgi:hypothetical protein